MLTNFDNNTVRIGHKNFTELKYSIGFIIKFKEIYYLLYLYD